MSFLKRVFSWVKAKIRAEFTDANLRELTDEAVHIALVWIRVAATKYADNVQKREWVVSILVARGFPESVARLSVELAYQIFKQKFESETVKPS